MKKILMITGILLTTAGAMAQGSPAEEVSRKIAQKMKDTLELTVAQQQQVFEINMQLNNRKAEYRKQYGTAAGPYLQLAENTRDSLYKQVLPEDKFTLYRKKKRNIVSNN